MLTPGSSGSAELRKNRSLIWRLDRQQDQIRGSTVIGYPVNLLGPPGEISSSRPFLPILASRRPTQPLTLADGTLQTGFSPSRTVGWTPSGLPSRLSLATGPATPHQLRSKAPERTKPGHQTALIDGSGRLLGGTAEQHSRLGPG